MFHPAHVALIDETGQVSAKDLSAYAAALNEQVTSDFGPVWGARAIVAAYTDKTKPPHAWALRIKDALDQPGALGYHTDALNQPVSYVQLDDTVSVTLSHELLEMLADPWGNRMHAACPPAGLNPSSIGLASGDHVSYLVEVADPCEATSYKVAGVAVSDFILPSWYRVPMVGVSSYSRAHGCTGSLQIATGGYASFARADGEWFQVFNQAGRLQLSDLGKFSKTDGLSLREWVDARARDYRRSAAIS